MEDAKKILKQNFKIHCSPTLKNILNVHSNLKSSESSVGKFPKKENCNFIVKMLLQNGFMEEAGIKMIGQ